MTDSAADAVIPRKPPAVDQIKQGHPVLLVQDWTAVAAKVTENPVAANWLTILEGRAESMLTEAPLDAEALLSDQTRLLALNRIYAASALRFLAEDSRFEERIRSDMLALATLPDWSHATDWHLTMLITQAVAIGYDWNIDLFSNEEASLIREALYSKALAHGLEVYAVPQDNEVTTSGIPAQWRNRDTYLNLISNAGLVMAALAIARDETDESRLADLEILLRFALFELDEGVPGSAALGAAGFRQDGSWPEGYGFWNDAARHLILLIASLESSMGDSFGLGDTPGLDRITSFGKHVVGPTGQLVAFSDTPKDYGSFGNAHFFWLGLNYPETESASLGFVRLAAQTGAGAAVKDAPFDMVQALLWIEAEASPHMSPKTSRKTACSRTM